MSDPNRPNHYFDDSLGDPYTCTGDHNHPARPAMPPCSRCGGRLDDDHALVGAIGLELHMFGIEEVTRSVLCGPCAVDLMEYILPGSTNTEDGRELRALWGLSDPAA